MAGKRQQKKVSSRKRRNDAGTPESGSGRGRKDVTGITNVYPASGPVRPPSGNAKLQPLGTWGQADRGPEGYFDSGDSEIIPDPALLQKKQRTRKRK